MHMTRQYRDLMGLEVNRICESKFQIKITTFVNKILKNEKVAF